jgi:phosphoglycolate phosphatase
MPAPQPEAAGTMPAGDAERDIQAGRHAGMKTLVALFGYISKDETPQNWG